MTSRGEERRWLDVDSGASGDLRALLESAGDDGGGRDQIERIRGRLGVLIGPAFGGDGPPAPPEPGPPPSPDASPAPAPAPAAPPAAAAPPSPLGATAGKVALGKALALKPLLVGIAIGVLGGSAVTWQVSSSLHAPVAVSASASAGAAPKGVRVAPALPQERADEAPVAPPVAPAMGTSTAAARVDEGAVVAQGPADAAPLAEPGPAPGPDPLAPIALGAPSAAPATSGGEAPASPPLVAQVPVAPSSSSPSSPPASAALANADAVARPPALLPAGPPASPRPPPNAPANEPAPSVIFDDPHAAFPVAPGSAPAAMPGRPPALAAATPGRPSAPAAATPGRASAPAAPPGRSLPAAGPPGLPVAPGATLPGFPPPPGAAPPGPPRAAVSDGAPATGSAAAAPSAVPPLRLVDEVRLLRAAQEALVQSPARAFDLTEEHRRRFPAGSLVQEREVFAVEALWRTGRRGVALERAKRFLAAHPDSSHATRLRSLVGVEK